MKKDAKMCRIKPEAEEKFNGTYDRKMSRTVYGHKACLETLEGEKGFNTFIFPGGISAYWRATRKPDFSKFEFS